MSSIVDGMEVSLSADDKKDQLNDAFWVVIDPQTKKDMLEDAYWEIASVELAPKLEDNLEKEKPIINILFGKFFTDTKDIILEKRSILTEGINNFFDDVSSKISDSGVRVYNATGSAIIGAVNAGTSAMTTGINAGLRVAEAALSSLSGAVNKWISFL